MVFPIPVHRFFDKKKYAQELFEEGRIRFTPVHAFISLEDDRFRDEGEQYYEIQDYRKRDIVVDGKIFSTGSIGSQYRKIGNAWAFCATTSLVSTARKDYCVTIKDFGKFVLGLEAAIQKYFGQHLLVLFGPVTYYNPNHRPQAFTEAVNPPYFCKPHQFMNDHEFRIVIVPSDAIYDEGIIQPLTLEINNPTEIFCETLLIHPK